MKQILHKLIVFSFSLFLVAGLSACGSKTYSVRFKVNSEPEGAYLLYRLAGANNSQWIYLGNTPFQGEYLFDKEQLQESEKITLRVMQPGYLDQTREWAGESFYEEAKEKGVIFWTPEMIPSSRQ